MVVRNGSWPGRRRPRGLVLERREGEEIVIRHAGSGEEISVWLAEVRHGQRAKLVLCGGRGFHVRRGELPPAEVVRAHDG